MPRPALRPEPLDELPDDPRGLIQDLESHTFLIRMGEPALPGAETRDDASGQREEVGGVAATRGDPLLDGSPLRLFADACAGSG